HVVQEIHLDRQRFAANELNDCGGRPRQPESSAASTDREEQAEHNGDQNTDQGDTDGVERGTQQVGKDLPGIAPVEQGHDRPPRIRPRARRRSIWRMPKLMAWARMKYISSARLKISRV